MTTEPDSHRQPQWVLAVRRSFGIPDPVDDNDARRALVGWLEELLLQNGWHSGTRAIADAMVDALIVLAASGELDDGIPGGVLSTVTTHNVASRLIDKAVTVVDPEYLVIDLTSGYPPEIVEVAEGVLGRVFQYALEQPFGD
jgi:hypothetical protein